MTATPESPRQSPDRRKRWTRDEVRFLMNSGLLNEPFELLDGEIVFKMAKNPPHVTATRRAQRWAEHVFGPEQVRVQDPIILDGFNEPEPDIAVTTGHEDDYVDLHPTASELALVIEVSDSTLTDDLTGKARRYARAGIADYWAIDLTTRRLHVHREPQEEGYGIVLTLAETQLVAPLAAPSSMLRVGDILPPSVAEGGA